MAYYMGHTLCHIISYNLYGISNLNFIYENDQHKKLNAFDNFEITTPTHIGATHAISKFERKSQNRIPRELDQKFGIPGIGTIH